MRIEFETNRCVIRDIRMSDAEGMFALDSDPEVHKYLGNYMVHSIEESEKVISYIQAQYEKNGMGRLAIINKKTGEFMGWTGIKYEEEVRDDMNYYDLGYRLRPQFWGKGIATETAIASLDYGFESLELSEIYAAADIDNIGSNRVLIKVGMHQLEPFICDGVMHNWYSVSKDEWLQNK